MSNLGSSLSFEGQVKPDAISVDSYDGELFAKRVVEIPSNMQKRLDYGARTDAQPVYVGFAPKGYPEGTDGWLLYYLQYDVSDRVTSVNVEYGNWTGHVSAFA